MEEELPGKIDLNLKHWQPVKAAALPTADAKEIAQLLVSAKNPLVVTSWIGNDPLAADGLAKLVNMLAIPVLDA